MEEYLYDVSKVRSEKFLAENYIKECLEYMEQFIRGSTRYYFEQNEFYKELPQNLKHKLV